VFPHRRGMLAKVHPPTDYKIEWTPHEKHGLPNPDAGHRLVANWQTAEGRIAGMGDEASGLRVGPQSDRRPIRARTAYGSRWQRKLTTTDAQFDFGGDRSIQGILPRRARFRAEWRNVKRVRAAREGILGGGSLVGSWRACDFPGSAGRDMVKRPQVGFVSTRGLWTRESYSLLAIGGSGAMHGRRARKPAAKWPGR